MTQLASGTEAARIAGERGRWVARGVSTTPLVVARAEGAQIEDVDGRTYIDFAGGIGCQNLGHGHPAVVAAIHEQVDRYLHQCVMVGLYEPYVDVCRRLGELSPCTGAEQKSLLVNSGAEAVENAVKIARAATGRPAVLVFDNSFHGRTLLTMTMTAKLVYRKGFGPFAPEVYRAPAPYPYRGISTDEALSGLELLFKRELDPASVACVVLEPVQGEGGFIPMPHDFPAELLAVCREHGILYVDDEVQSGVGRTGRVWAIEHYDAAPDLLVSGKSLGGGLPLAGVTGNAEIVDTVAPGWARRARSAATRCRARPRWPCSTRSRRRTSSRARRSWVRGSARGSTTWPSGFRPSARCAASARCSPSSWCGTASRRSRRRELASGAVNAARERGLVLLSCGLHGNVVRVLVPLVIGDDDLERGLQILEESLVAAGSGGA